MELSEIFKTITTFVLSFFSVFLLFYKVGNRKSNVLLGIIIGIHALELLNATFYTFPNYWINQYPWAFYSTEITFFLWGPAIYFFLKATTEATFAFRFRHLWHLVPVVCHTAILILRFHIFSYNDKIDLLNNGVFSPLEDSIIHITKNVAAIVYLFLSIRLFLIYKKTVYLRDNHLVKTSIDWLKFLLVIFVIVELFQIVCYIDLEIRNYHAIIYNTIYPLWFIIAVLILYRSLTNPLFFQYVPFEEKEQLTNQIDNSEIITLAQRIEDIIIKGELYKNSELQLNNIANELNITTKKVSQVINIHFEKNFPDFVNYYRIEKAKKLLKDPLYNQEKILSVAFDVGFNSKASFNRVFKKITGTTPTLFKKQNTGETL